MMKRGVEVENGVEMPPTTLGRPFLYPWKTMEVGQSFVYKGKFISAVSACAKWGKKTQRDFAVRKMDAVVRVWRTL